MSRYTFSCDKWQNAYNKRGRDDNSKRVIARTNRNGTIVIVPKRILAVSARHLQHKTTMILNPVMCMERNPSIHMTSAAIIQKMPVQQTSLITTLKNVNTTRTTKTIDVSAAGTNPQASAILPCQVTGKSTTSQATAVDPPWIIILILLIKHKKRWLVEPKDVGHKSPASKKRKSLVEPDLAIKGKLYEKQISPKKLHPSKSDGDLLNLYDDDVMSDNAKSSLSITNDNGLSFANLDEDDAFGFDNWRSTPVELGKKYWEWYCLRKCTVPNCT